MWCYEHHVATSCKFSCPVQHLRLWAFSQSAAELRLTFPDHSSAWKWGRLMAWWLIWIINKCAASCLFMSASTSQRTYNAVQASQEQRAGTNTCKSVFIESATSHWYFYAETWGRSIHPVNCQLYSVVLVHIRPNVLTEANCALLLTANEWHDQHHHPWRKQVAS